MKEQALVKGRHGKFECGYGIGRVSVGEEREKSVLLHKDDMNKLDTQMKNLTTKHGPINRILLEE